MKKIRIWFLRQKLGILKYRLANLWQFSDSIGNEYLKEQRDIQNQIVETNESLRKLTDKPQGLKIKGK